MSNKNIWVIVAYGVVIGLLIPLGMLLASLCNPNAVWLWRDMLGVAVGLGC